MLYSNVLLSGMRPENVLDGKESLLPFMAVLGNKAEFKFSDSRPNHCQLGSDAGIWIQGPCVYLFRFNLRKSLGLSDVVVFAQLYINLLCFLCISPPRLCFSLFKSFLFLICRSSVL